MAEATDQGKLKTLHANLLKEGFDLPDYDKFKVDMSNEATLAEFHDNLTKEGFDLPDIETFKSDMGLKKKDSLEPILPNSPMVPQASGEVPSKDLAAPYQPEGLISPSQSEITPVASTLEEKITTLPKVKAEAEKEKLHQDQIGDVKTKPGDPDKKYYETERNGIRNFWQLDKTGQRSVISKDEFDRIPKEIEIKTAADVPLRVGVNETAKESANRIKLQKDFGKQAVVNKQEAEANFEILSKQIDDQVSELDRHKQIAAMTPLESKENSAALLNIQRLEPEVEASKKAAQEILTIIDENRKVKDALMPVSYTGGAVKSLAEATADATENLGAVMHAVSKAIIPGYTNTENPLKGLAKKVKEKLDQELGDMPNTIPGAILGGVAGTIPMIAATTMMPAWGISQSLALPLYMASDAFGREFGKRQSYLESGYEGLKGGAEGAILHGLGVGAGKVADKVTGFKSGIKGSRELIGGEFAATAAKEVASKPYLVLNATTAALVNAGGYTGYATAKKWYNGEPITWKDAASEFGVGIALAGPSLAKVMFARAMDRTLKSDAETIKQAIAIPGTVEAIRNKAIDIGESVPKIKDASEKFVALKTAQTLNTIADIKAISTDIAKDPSKYVESISSSDMPDAEKSKVIDKINEIAEDNNVKRNLERGATEELNKIDAQIAANKKSVEGLHPEIAKKSLEQKNKPLEEQKKFILEDFEKKTKELEEKKTEKELPKEEQKIPTIEETIGKPIIYNGSKGILEQDGKTLIARVTDTKGKEVSYEIGNIDELGSKPINELGVRESESVVSVNEKGGVLVRDKEYVNNFSDPMKAINKDEKGNIVSVNLETPTGEKRAFRGQVAEDIAYQIKLAEGKAEPKIEPAPVVESKVEPIQAEKSETAPAETPAIKAEAKLTPDQINALNEEHKSLYKEYLDTQNSLIQAGLPVDKLKNHDLLTRVQSKMDAIEATLKKGVEAKEGQIQAAEVAEKPSKELSERFVNLDKLEEAKTQKIKDKISERLGEVTQKEKHIMRIFDKLRQELKDNKILESPC